MESAYCSKCGSPVGKGNPVVGDSEFVHYRFTGGDNETKRAFVATPQRDDDHEARAARDPYLNLLSKQFGER